MEQLSKRTVTKDERDKQIEKAAKVYALEWMIALTQVLTIMCIIKKNPAWKGTLSSLFFGVAFILFYEFKQYEEKPFKQVGIVFLIIGIALLIWFGVTG